MKNNGNNERIGSYYAGLDVGTNSVGWAVTDKEYNILRFKGNAMWGVSLFDEAQTAEGRRMARTNRRRLARRKQRLLLLEMLFSEAINKIDPTFFHRLHESDLRTEDKKLAASGRYLLFNDDTFTDKEYSKRWPTIYHLRHDLINSQEKFDVRLVFLALHHIIKSRGHFLYEIDNAGSDDFGTLTEQIDELISYLSDEFDTTLEFSNRREFEEVLVNKDYKITEKKRRLAGCIKAQEGSEAASVSLSALSDILAGATVKLADLYCDEELKDAEPKSISLKEDIEEKINDLDSALGERINLLFELKKVFDTARLAQILGDCRYICDAKIALYDKNKKELMALKKYVRKAAPDKYKLIFSERSGKINNFQAYCRYKDRSGEYSCTQEEFCAFLKKELPGMEHVDDMREIWEEIKEKTFFTKLKGTDNGVIPNQLHRRELTAILEKAAAYLEFLNVSDDGSLTVKDKIIKIFDYRIPYYVGPLNKKSEKSWVERKEGKIYPWNFEEVVDTGKSAENFILNLIGRCSYTGEKVIPQDSLLYSEFMLLNEINPLKVNGYPLPVDIKQTLIDDLFIKSFKKVTKKKIKEYLMSKGLIKDDDELSGIDDEIKTKLRSYHDFKTILDSTYGRDKVEEIITDVCVFGGDKIMLRKRLKSNYSKLSSEDIKRICRLNYKKWGRLSREFLSGITGRDSKGSEYSVIEALRNTNDNLMQMLSDRYSFAVAADEYRRIHFAFGEDSFASIVNDMYLSPAVKRGVLQALRIVDEIVDIKKSAPEKLFIEVARGEEAKKRTVSRKDSLLKLYKDCGKDNEELFERLKDEPDERLRRDKLYLYYTQFGKCMYSGETIEIESLGDDNLYDIDHIFPRSRIKDDSLDNRVLVKSTLNREKTNAYPLSAEVRDKMKNFWYLLKDKKLISEKKYDRLIRHYSLTDEELAAFVNRQLTETQQSTKAIAAVMKELYPETKIVYSKAGNVSDFRQQRKLVKCREVNDLHHAKDAYLNIVVGNVYDTKFTANFFMNIRNEKYSVSRVFDFDTPGAWETGDGGTMATVDKYMRKNNIKVVCLPHEAKGALFDLQLLPAGNGQLSVKKSKDIAKYGGYNNLSGAYFFVVEHTVRNKRVRSIKPVLLYKKELYERDPEAYCREILNLEHPEIKVTKIRFDSLLEIDGLRLNITGRTEERFLYKHATQLAIDSTRESYVKKLSKYVKRCAEAKGHEAPLTVHDGIAKKENEDLYDWFSAKLAANAYGYGPLCNVRNYLVEDREKFIALSAEEQSKLLVEILKTFRCNSQWTNLKKLGRGDCVGSLKLSCNITDCRSAYIINQSPTGLYETKVDLLR